MLKSCQDLPNSLKNQYHEIWDEYQKHSSEEAKLVHQIDKLEMALQAIIYHNEGQDKEKLSSFLETAEENITHPKLKELFREIIESKNNG